MFRNISRIFKSFCCFCFINNKKEIEIIYKEIKMSDEAII